MTEIEQIAKILKNNYDILILIIQSQNVNINIYWKKINSLKNQKV